jgi:glycosyltransferase involved in cell wall biosynthesis
MIGAHSGTRTREQEDATCDGEAAKRLLIVVNVSWAFISHRLELARHAAALGYEVHVATQVTNEHDARVIQDAGLVLHDIGMGRGDAGMIHDLGSLVRLCALFKRLDPAVVHLVTAKPAILGGIAARIAGIPAVVAAIAGLGHVFTDTGYRAWVRRRVVLSAMRRAMAHPRIRAIFQNDEDRRTLVNAGVIEKSQAILIRGAGVDPAAYPLTPEPAGPLRVLFASRMIRTKGVAEFVACASALGRTRPGTQFLIAGAPDLANPESLRLDELEQWQSEGHVSWLGHVKDMAALIASCHMFVLPTYYGEGVPKVLIEAAACGRPIVTTDIAGCRDIVKDGENGILVPPRDVEQLTAAVERLLADPTLRAEFGRAGRQQVEQGFGLQTVLDQTVAIYDELTA